MTTNFGDAVTGVICLDADCLCVHHDPPNWDRLTDAELKVTLGRLVDGVADGARIQRRLGEIPTSGRLWHGIVHHVCLERIQSPRRQPRKRASWKVADYLRHLGQQHVKCAFMQTLEFCCDHFDDKFDALFQRVAAVVDFGRQLEPKTAETIDITTSDSFFKILKVQDTTSDGNVHRLAFRLAQFLSRLNSPNGQTFEVPDTIRDDLVARLFDENETHDLKQTNGQSMAVDSDGEDAGFSMPDDELRQRAKHRGPKTVVEFMDAFRSSEEPTIVLVAFYSFPEFAERNQSAVRAQSAQLLRTLANLENRFHLKDFNFKVTNCLVHTLGCDLTAVPEFCERLRSAHGPPERSRVISVIKALIQHLALQQENPLPDPTITQTSTKRTRQQKEIGKVVRKSVTLTGPTSSRSSQPKPAVDVIDPILRPFLHTLLSMDVKIIQEPMTASGILHVMNETQRLQLSGFRRIVDEYFKLLAKLRDTPDWNTQLLCAESYAMLAQLGVQHVNEPTERAEWASYLDGVDRWLESLVQKSIGQSNQLQHDQLDGFYRGIRVFLGKIND